VRTELGVCQWFHYEAYDDLARAVTELRALGVERLRTGISWADAHRPGGLEWYDHQMEALAGFDVLLSVWHTPPSISEGGTTSSPPRRLQDYADFIDQVIDRWGHRFSWLELWNEPNNRYKWDFARFDPQWEKLGHMLAMAGHWARTRGKPTVLGGMIPVDPSWLRLMQGYGVLDHVDAVAIHGFPHMWWDDAPCWDWQRDWHGWAHKLATIREHVEGRPVWVTETGLATWDLPRGVPARHALQSTALREAAAAPAERVYWYSLIDLDPAREAIEGFHVDENEYHLGLCTYDGERKPAWGTMAELLRAGEARAERGQARARPQAATGLR
jgi:CDP-paratose 2-epimerase